MKKCNKCGVEKELTKEFFPVNTRYKSGFVGTCKECTNRYRREWLITTSPEQDEARSEYRKKWLTNSTPNQIKARNKYQKEFDAKTMTQYTLKSGITITGERLKQTTSQIKGAFDVQTFVPKMTKQYIDSRFTETKVSMGNTGLKKSHYASMKGEFAILTQSFVATIYPETILSQKEL
jgi:hypothetical protein